MAIPRQRIHLPPASWRSAFTGTLTGTLWDGKDIARFEESFADATGSPHAIAVASGRAGLCAALDALDLEPGSEIICSAFGYPVVPHLVKHLGYRLRFVDCELTTLGMDPDALVRVITPQTGAVIATHLYGLPCQIRRIADLTRANGVALIEDCAHCFGASCGGQQAGTFGTVGYFSFETSKMINTLGGGMITTGDTHLAARIREAGRGQAQRTFKWLIHRLGKTTFEAAVTNPLLFSLGVGPALQFVSSRNKSDNRFASGYQADHFTMSGRTGRYTNYQARLGLRQLDRIDVTVGRRIQNASRLIDQLSDRVTFQHPFNSDDQANYMLVTAMFADRQRVGAELLSRGVDTKCHYMRDCARLIDTGETFENAATAEANVLHLPAHPELRESQIDYIAAAVREVVEMPASPLARAA